MPKALYLSDMSVPIPTEALGVADAGLAINPIISFLLVRARVSSPKKRPRPLRARPRYDGESGLMRLSPRDPLIGIYFILFSRARQRSASAISTRRSTNTIRRSTSGFGPFFAYADLAAAYALMQAGWRKPRPSLAEARRLNPNLTVKWMIEHTSNLPAVFDGLRKAGFFFFLPGRTRMSETRKLAAILAADVVGYFPLVGADEDRTLARLQSLAHRSDRPGNSRSPRPRRQAHRRRLLIEFRSVVEAARCAIEIQKGLVERNAGLPPEHRIEFRVGIHLGDIVEEATATSWAMA